MTGIFPCIVAEECRWDGEPLSPMGEEDEEFDEEDGSDSGIPQPCYTPPEIPSHLLPAPDTMVIVTQPTPTVEHSSPQHSADHSEEKSAGKYNLHN